MMNYEDGDIVISKILLEKITPEGQLPIDLRSQVVELSIFEDIQQPTMMLDIILSDSINLVGDYPIIGEEKITVSYYTPGRDLPTRKTFYIFNISSTQYSPQNKASFYRIRAVSPIHFANTNNFIEKAYKDTISKIAQDIIQTMASDVGIVNQPVYVESTKGIVPMVIPSLRPLEAIDFLRQRAVSSQYKTGGGYIFFENQHGLHFRSVSDLINDNKNNVGTKKFKHKPAAQEKIFNPESFRNIINLNHITKFDTIEKITSGVFNNSVNSFDLLKKSTETFDFLINDKASSIVPTDSKFIFPNSSSFINKNLKKSASSFYTLKDSSRGNDFVDEHLGSSSVFLTLLEQNILRLYVYGDSYLSAGDVIEVELPDPSGLTNKKDKDKTYSGNYLVIRLRHLIAVDGQGRPKHNISMDCAKIGSGI